MFLYKLISNPTHAQFLVILNEGEDHKYNESVKVFKLVGVDSKKL